MNYTEYFYEQFENIPEDEYAKLWKCKNCGETNEHYLDWPIFNSRGYPQIPKAFELFRCLSCGAYGSLAKNLWKLRGMK